jgi:uncharacterized protein YgiB involved in biofilm formation
LHQPNLGPVLSRAPRSREARQQRQQLVAWSVVLGGFLVWAVWPEEETGAVVYSKTGCSAVPEVPLADCEAAYDRSVADHLRIAPRFDSRFQCDQQFGACQADPDDARFWIPPLAGVLIGYREREHDAGGISGGGYVSGYRHTGALPVYRERSGDYLNPHGDFVSSPGGKVTGSAGGTTPPARAITISRSGFGSIAGARSSFGG